VNRSQPYAVQQPDGTYRWVHASCKLQELAAHLEGEWTLALSSTDRHARCKWLCLDEDAVGGDVIAQLVVLQKALAELELPALLEASRRGGHLWLLLDAPTPVVLVRRVMLHALDELRAGGLEIPALEVYPDAAAEAPRALGHAVRLPLGIHRLTGKRYVLFDERGSPCAFTTTEAAMRFVLGWPRVVSTAIAQCARELGPSTSSTEPNAPQRARVGTHSPVIRWVDANVSSLDLLADLAPESAMHPVGRGYLGWCPFHDDQAPDAAGKPGTPSFYVVLDRMHGWSWRCFSSNCPQSWGPMRHSFELFQRLLGLTVRSAIVEACTHWPECDAAHPEQEAVHAQAR
jgi:hypothetical protein